MKLTIPIAVSTAFIFAAGYAWGVDEHHPDAKAPTAKSAPASAVKAPAPAATVRKMQDNVKTLQGQLDRIAKAKTDEERQRAIADHMKTMQENMGLARSMQPEMKMDCPMMGSGMGNGMGMMGGAGPEGMQQMEKRMDMMQTMMEQMSRRMDAVQAK
jgi:hypothetical protein